MEKLNNLLQDIALEQMERQLITPIAPEEKIRCTCGHYLKYHTLKEKVFQQIGAITTVDGKQYAKVTDVVKTGQFCRFNLCRCKGFKKSEKQNKKKEE
jgi:hypothetical protein